MVFTVRDSFIHHLNNNKCYYDSIVGTKVKLRRKNGRLGLKLRGQQNLSIDDDSHVAPDVISYSLRTHTVLI